jgi:trimeric autotransporter adhesin
MRRFLTLVCLLCLAIPAGISISGCTRNPGENYCNGLGYGQKIGSLYSITLKPQTTGISLAFGQTKTVTTPTAVDCKGSSVSVSSYTYGTTNNQLMQISPSGTICAGTWNLNSGGGIADYTICSAPSSLPSTNGLPYGVAYLSASADSVTSNAVPVYVHQAVSSVSLVGPTSCVSQNNTATLDEQACYTSGGVQYQFCAPTTMSSSKYACTLKSGSTIPACDSSIGTPSFTVGTSTIASIDSTTNVITAALPGTTSITASIAGSGSSAGYFSTCPPASISIALSSGNGTVTKGVTQDLSTTIIDTAGNTITGLSLDYQSTDPTDISVTSAGAITPSYAGAASVYAVCQPTTCNPAPTNVFGQYGTGLSIASNAVTITTPGTASQYVWYGAPGQSQYYVPVSMLTGTVGSAVKLPYVPNSMVMDKTGTNLYFGSSHELMIYGAVANSVTTLDTNVPGVVLAVSPDDKQVLINDQDQGKFYLYTVSGATYSIYGGRGTAASWTPDSKTLYIVDSAKATDGGTHTNTLYVYNVGSGWSTYDLTTTTTTTSRNLAITVPGVGAYLSGNSTIAHTWCPTGTITDSVSSITAFYPHPVADTVAQQTDVLAATTDGAHILGAAVTSANEVTLSDIGVKIPTTKCTVTTDSSTGVQTLSALSTDPTLKKLLTLDATQVNANISAINQVAVSPQSSLAFITYTSDGSKTGATLPYYIPDTETLSYLSLTDSTTPTITAPIAGAFAPDDSYFFVSTAGDNMIHYIKIPTSTSSAPTDSKQISPNLPACSETDEGCTHTGTGSIVPASVITVRPRTTT